MELSSKLSKNYFEISTKREAAAIVLVGFQTGEFCYSTTITMQDLHYSTSRVTLSKYRYIILTQDM